MVNDPKKELELFIKSNKIQCALISLRMYEKTKREEFKEFYRWFREDINQKAGKLL